MTKRENDVYNFIKEFKTTKHYSPTIREIADGIHTVSYTSVKDILERLKEKNILSFEHNKSRTIVLQEECQN